MRGWLILVASEMRVMVREGGGAGLVLAVFVVAGVYVSVALGPGLGEMDGQVAPVVVWVLVLLGHVFSLQRVFGEDAEDGTLMWWRTLTLPMEWIVASKGVAHMLVVGVPMVVVGPVVGVLLDVVPSEVGLLVAGLALGAMGMSFFGVLGAALAVRVRGGGLLAGLLAMPLQGSLVVLGLVVVEAGRRGDGVWEGLTALTLVSGLGLVVGVWVGAAVLRRVGEW